MKKALEEEQQRKVLDIACRFTDDPGINDLMAYHFDFDKMVILCGEYIKTKKARDAFSKAVINAFIDGNI